MVCHIFQLKRQENSTPHKLHHKLLSELWGKIILVWGSKLKVKICRGRHLLVILIAGIFPRASFKKARASQSHDGTYPCAVIFTSPLTNGLFSQLQELLELPTSPTRMLSSSKSISSCRSWCSWLLCRELNPCSGGAKLMLYQIQSTHSRRHLLCPALIYLLHSNIFSSFLSNLGY